ncbi:MAG: hypothetical protein AAGO57_07225 [Pseudomonadota bacterium]
MLRLFGFATLLIRPGVWVLIGAAFLGGIAYEKSAQLSRCDDAGGAMASGVCLR